MPILGGGHSAVALRRAAALCDGWIAAGAYSEAEAWTHLDSLRKALAKAGRRDEPFVIYLSLAERPDADLYRRFEDAGVTDMVCAPWMFVADPAGARPTRSWPPASAPASGSPSTSSPKWLTHHRDGLTHRRGGPAGALPGRPVEDTP